MAALAGDTERMLSFLADDRRHLDQVLSSSMELGDSQGRTAAPIVVIDDDELVGRAFVRTLAPFWETRLFKTAREFNTWFCPERKMCALLIDEFLPDGRGNELARAVRNQPKFKYTPITIVTGEHSPAICSNAYQLQARYLCKPVEPGDLMTFLASAVVFHTTGDRPHTEAVAHTLVSRRGLSPSKIDLVLRQMRGERGSEITKARGITLNTYKSCVRSILNKTRLSKLSLLIQRIHAGT